jgi:tetratricopeptide (TPR) repeat protein
MTTAHLATIALLTLALAAPVSAQRVWVEARGPNVTVISDGGAGRARDVAWQFEQVREAMARNFPWVRSQSSKPRLVLAARNETSMRELAPGYWEKSRETTLAGVTATGLDRAYLLLRSDLKNDDREGINPYESAYWGYASQALQDTSRAWPSWLSRGMAAVVSNTLVRDQEIQLGRVLPQHLSYLRERGRMPLKDVVSVVTGADPRYGQSGFLQAIDAHAWAFVHFLLWADRGAHQANLDKYIVGVLQGADPVTSLAATLGDVSRFDSAFNVYVNRDVFGFTRFETSAKVSREGFEVRDLPPAESATVRAAFHVAMGRSAEAKTLAAEAQRLEPAGVADEVAALLADHEDRVDDLRASLEKAVGQRYVTWYAPYRLATLLSEDQGSTALPRMESLLTRAAALNPNADDALAFLAEVMAALDRGDRALEPIGRAIELMPASSAHRVSLARVLRALDRPQEALKAAGIARALAKTPEDRARATDELSALARSMAAEAAPGAVAAADPSVAAPDRLEPAMAKVGAADGRESTSGAREIGELINDCFAGPAACQAVLPAVVEDCTAGRTVTSTAACRSAGYILDAGLGMPAAPQLAAGYYLQGCNRQDELSCVRLATLRSLGRGVARDAQSALAVLEPSCTSGTQEACYRLGLHLASTGVAADRARAHQVLTASCQADFPESCAALKKLPPGQ